MSEKADWLKWQRSVIKEEYVKVGAASDKTSSNTQIKKR